MGRNGQESEGLRFWLCVVYRDCVLGCHCRHHLEDVILTHCIILSIICSLIIDTTFTMEIPLRNLKGRFKMAVGKAKISIKDKSNEVNGFGFYTPELDAGNVADYASVAGTLMNNVLTGLTLVVNGTVRSAGVTAFNSVISEAIPASNEAHNEKRLLLKYFDTVETDFKGRMEIPCFNVGAYLTEGSDIIDLTQTNIAQLVTALEAAAVSKLGNPIQIYEGVFVGRNS